MYDHVEVAFSSGNLLLLNVILAMMMFVVSLRVAPADFVRVIRAPRAPVAGLLAQFVLLPAVTCAATVLLDIDASLALGMLLVACCPGGTFSNVMTWLGRGSVPVSVSMTAVSSLAATVMTPFNFAFYGQLNPATRELLTEIAIDPLRMMLLVVLVLAVPMMLGMLLGQRFPRFAERSETPMRALSLAIFFGFVIFAFSRNTDVLFQLGFAVIGLVIAHNLLALTLGTVTGYAIGLPVADRRAVTMEIGIQNTGLALGIIFNFFPAAGSMTLVAGMWSIWHLIAGLTLALVWSRRKLPAAEVCNA